MPKWVQEYEVRIGVETTWGTTGTCGGPAGSADRSSSSGFPDIVAHSRINSQAIHDLDQPQISRANLEEVVGAALREGFEAIGEDSEEEDSEEEDSEEEDSEEEATDELCGVHHSGAEEDQDADFGTGAEESHQGDVIMGDGAGPLLGTSGQPFVVGGRCTHMSLTPKLTSEISLMSIMIEHKMPNAAFKSIMRWAAESSRQGMVFRNSMGRSRKAVLKEVRKLNPELEDFEDKFQSVLLPEWRPKPTQAPVQTFHKAVKALLNKRSLFKEENISLPNSESPFEHSSVPPTAKITELHHGTWWRSTWEKKCNPTKREMLVPVILHMDGVSLDNGGRLSLTPLKMTLGVFSTEARKKPEAWENLMFFPKTNKNGGKLESIDNIRNLHHGLRVGLESLREACAPNEAFPCLGFPWAGKKWDVLMKFSVAFVIGDTEQHDQLCGRFGARQRSVNFICRHCNCKTDDLADPDKQQACRLWKPSDFTAEKFQSEELCSKKVSHHDVRNAFHDICFGTNEENIHFGSPGELLHMHQLGVAKRAVEGTRAFLERSGLSKPVIEGLEKVAFRIGSLLARQSQRNLPRTRVSQNSTHLKVEKKEGHMYSGMILSLLITLHSDEAKSILTNRRGARGLCKTLEHIICMEEFFKHGELPIEDLAPLRKHIDFFMKLIVDNCKRLSAENSMGNNLTKNHLCFHLPRCIELHGPPLGWDSSPAESHHKTEIKAPARNTQRNATNLPEQTAKRCAERDFVSLVMDEIKHSEIDSDECSDVNIGSRAGGSLFRIQLDTEGKPFMEWRNAKNRDKQVPCHPSDVIEYCWAMFGGTGVKFLEGFTEHQRSDGENVHMFRAHPSYRSNAGQTNSVWYDWAMFQYKDNDEAVRETPAQILCFLQVNSEPHAIVRSFRDPPKAVTGSTIVMRGTLDERFYTYQCDNITDVAAVVENVGSQTNQFFFVQGREHWLRQFCEDVNNCKENDVE